METLASTATTTRLRPLLTATWLQAVILWVPVEKLFLEEIGFDAGSVALMAAAYAAVVPFLEIPSGILADRWSRRGVLVIGHGALAASALVGGLATSVLTYIAAALLLGVFFAMRSGTVDALVYDMLVEDTGRSDDFERVMGRLRAWESTALVSSALAGGGLAALMSPRATYFLTVPFGIASVWFLMSLDEPRLHKVGERLSLRAQIATTYRVLLTDRAPRSVIATMVLAGLLLQALLEFGPLWMVALAAPAFLYGPHWAGLMGALGLGGILAGRASFTATGPLVAATGVLIGGSTMLAVSHQAIVVVAAQVAIATVLVAVSAFLSRLLHDEIPSSLRAGIASGVGTLTWIVFLPSALAFGSLADQSGVYAAAWQLIALAVLVSASLVRLAIKQRTLPAAPGVAMAAPPTVVEARSSPARPVPCCLTPSLQPGVEPA
jgi:MFS family permease